MENLKWNIYTCSTIFLLTYDPTIVTISETVPLFQPNTQYILKSEKNHEKYQIQFDVKR